MANEVAYYHLPECFRFGRLEMWIRNVFQFLKWEVALRFWRRAYANTLLQYIIRLDVLTTGGYVLIEEQRRLA